MPNWSDVLNEIQQLTNSRQASSAESQRLAALAGNDTRKKYLQLLQAKTGRNVIAYYSGFLSKPPVAPMDINDEDKNGFMMAVHRLDRSKGLDLILHTPGGQISATASIVDYLRRMFGRDIRAIVPQIAMSAGTMLACSCSGIVLGKHSNLGPIDPHLNNIPAHGVVQEFRRAHKEVKSDPTRVAVWAPIIGQYRPTFLSQCENAIRLSADFVAEQLETVMFHGEPNAKKRAKAIVKKLSDYRLNKSHSRHIHIDECVKLGLKIHCIEDDFDAEFQDLVLTVHHCYMHALMNSTAIKIIENHLGTALIKNARVQ